jgi:Rps23 Pro-64 3,4-dihydroxylase Tpa1-like proline 4-hydroxylase
VASVSPSQKMLSVGLLQRFRDATSAAYEAQKDSSILWRLAELDRALGNLPAAADGFKAYAKLYPNGYKSNILSELMGKSSSAPWADANIDGVAPFVVVEGLAPEEDLLMVRQAIEERRDGFAEAKVRYNDEHRVDVNTRSALFFRGDQQFRELSREFFRAAIRKHDVLQRLGLPSISDSREEVEAIAYTTGGKYTIHRDNGPGGDNGRRLTVVWFIHNEPKGFSGGDLLLHDEPPAGQGFTRVVPQRNTAVFFPSVCLHEVTPVESTVSDVLDSRVVLNGWFHRAED